MRKPIKRLTIIVAILAIAAVLLHNQVEGETVKGEARPSGGVERTGSQARQESNSLDSVRSKGAQVLQGKTIVIDPGHGGKDVGSIGKNGTYEKDVTLPAALELKRQLEKTGATVILTREEDKKVTLEQRVEIAEEEEADLFVSIHFDAYKSDDVSGMTTYYNKEDDAPLATVLHDQLFKQLMNTKDRGVQFGDYYVLRENARPSVLLELGYISNEREETRMKTDAFRQTTSQAIVKGIIACLT